MFQALSWKGPGSPIQLIAGFFHRKCFANGIKSHPTWFGWIKNKALLGCFSNATFQMKKSWRLRKKSFVSDIEQFWRKIHDESGVKNCKLFEGVSPSSCNLARRVMNPKIACGASKNRLFTSSSTLASWLYLLPLYTAKLLPKKFV